MNRTTYILAAITALFCVQGCTEQKIPVEEIPSEDQQEIIEDSSDSCYYILKSSGGVPESSTVLDSDIRNLRPYSAQIHLSETEDGLVNILIDYVFRTKEDYTSPGRYHSFSLCFENVPSEKWETVMLFDAKDLTGYCTIDEHDGSFTNASLTGSLGGFDSHLFIDGLFNGYPFVLDIASATTDKDSFVEEYIQFGWSGYGSSSLFLEEFEITNASGGPVNISIKDAGALDLSVRLEPDETRLICCFVFHFPMAGSVEITYENGEQVVVSYLAIGSTSNFYKTSQYNSWYLWAEITEYIALRHFIHENYTIN